MGFVRHYRHQCCVMVYRWIIKDCSLPDPGTYAVVGMAAFMGGSGRITVMLAVVLLELTADAGMIARRRDLRYCNVGRE